MEVDEKGNDQPRCFGIPHSLVQLFPPSGRRLMASLRRKATLFTLVGSSTTIIPDVAGFGLRSTTARATSTMPKVRRTRKSTKTLASASSGSSFSQHEQNTDVFQGQDDSRSLMVDQHIVREMSRQAKRGTKDWFENYVKGTKWLGCKTPTVHDIVKNVMKDREKDDKGEDHESTSIVVDAAFRLLQREECDVKLAGMNLLSQYLPTECLATESFLHRLESDILFDSDHVADWSTADWFAMKVLRKVVYHHPCPHNERLIQRVLDYTRRKDDSLWVRRCGVVAFLQYNKHRDVLPADFASRLIAACEFSLLASPHERFTQTGVAWVLRYVLLEPTDRDEALAMIVRNGDKWTTEAKKSLTEKMHKGDPRRKQILELGPQ